MDVKIYSIKMPRTPIEKLVELQQNPVNIRNVCIMAHVDHGKTTLADVLVASNGVISQKLAGKLRYLDSREDEQERGITMKSSSITLHHVKGPENYLINLIDSPGHVDFSNEVSTAVRLCDGAIVMVDIIEGVCSQTKISLRQVWSEGLRPVLVINKIDRLITERKLTPLDAYVCLQQTLEQVNAVMGELFTTEVFGRMQVTISNDEKPKLDESSTQVYDWGSGLDESDDSQVYFSPDQGNVVFACALDGWGFSIYRFASLYSAKMGIREDILKKTLWGDYYLNSKLKRIMKGAQAKAKKPLFVQLILENIWAVYDAVTTKKDREMIQKIVTSLNLKITPRDMKHNTLQAILNQWLPLSTVVLDMVVEKLPNPSDISKERVEQLMSSFLHRFDSLPEETRKLKADFLACKSTDDAPVIIFVSKMFPIEKQFLPQNKQRPLTAEEIALRRQRLAELKKASETGITISDKKDAIAKDVDNSNDCTVEPDQHAFIAFARIFSGRVKKGMKLHVLGPKHDPKEMLEKLRNGMTLDESLRLQDLKSNQHVTCCTIQDLYLLMGRDLESLNDVPAGNVFGIGNLEEHVLKTATLATTPACPPFIEMDVPVVPIVRVALEPAHPAEMQALIRGLKLLNQADACVQVLIQETGEHVIVTAGEIHLQRCLDDLKQRYAKIEINASKPIVAFRETIIPPPKVDMVNEAIEEKHQMLKHLKDVPEKNLFGLITISTSNKQSVVQIRAVPLPPALTDLLENNSNILRTISRNFLLHSKKCSDELRASVHELHQKFKSICEAAGKEWTDDAARVWAFGPRRCGPNLLINRVPHYKRPSIFATDDNCSLPDCPLSLFDSSFISGFQLATLSGPLSEEPLRGVGFVIENWTILNNEENNSDGVSLHKLTPQTNAHEANDLSNCKIQDEESTSRLKFAADAVREESSSDHTTPFGPFSGQIMSAVKEGCRQALQAQPLRMMTAMYTSNIQVTAEVLGKMYAVLNRRHGRVLSSDLQEGSQIFNIVATLPVIESFDFATEIRKQTSGMALPQLIFSHWEVVDVDPFWVPSTEEEFIHFGEKADSENRARLYMNMVRRRKGLSVDEKIVEHAEKQRTLTRNK